VGSGSRDVDAWRGDVSVRRGSGAPDADGPGACLSQPLGVGVDSLVFIHLIPRIDHKIRMVINRLNHLHNLSSSCFTIPYYLASQVFRHFSFISSDKTRKKILFESRHDGRRLTDDETIIYMC
jgi:hypothetical protein